MTSSRPFFASVLCVTLASLAGCGVGGGGAAREMFLYDGPPRSPTQEAVVKCEPHTVIVKAGGQTLNGKAGVHTLHLAPGDHELTVKAHRTTGNAFFETQPVTVAPFNAFPGQTVRVGGLVVDDRFYPMYDPPLDIDPVGKGYGIASGLEDVTHDHQQRMPEFPSGTATVSGVIYSREGPNWYGSAGRKAPVILLPASPEAEAWLTRRQRTSVPMPLTVFRGVLTAQPRELKVQQYTVRARPDGAFTFNNVGAGDYYLISRNRPEATVVAIRVEEGAKLRGIRIVEGEDAPAVNGR